MKVLVVDDEINKITALSDALRDAGLHLNIVHRSTSNAARKALQEEDYDMLVIDLKLPSSLADKPTLDGGFELLDMLHLDENVSVPPDVIFFTAVDESLEMVRREACARGAILLEFSSPAFWKPFLIAKVKQGLLRAKKRIPIVDIAIITALRKPELAAVLDLPYDWREMRFEGDPTVYFSGKFLKAGREIFVVAASAHRKGMPSSASLAVKMAQKFRPKYLVMLGICAGMPKKTNLGDIIIADPAWDYGSGKRALDDSGARVFLSAPTQTPLDPHIRNVAEELSLRSDVVTKIRASWTGSLPEGTLSARIGPMASGASVIADDEQARLIALQNRDVLGIEMEAYAVMAAVEYSGDPRPIPIAIKSVCDFADPSKQDDWQGYAAHTSAAFADSLFRAKDFKL